MKNLKELRAFEAIAFALIIVEILNQTRTLFLISSNLAITKGFDGPGIYLIVTIITALVPFAILYLIYKYAIGHCSQRYSPGMNMMVAGSIVLLMSVRGFAKYPEHIYDMSKLLIMMPDQRMLRNAVIFNGLGMASTAIGFVIAIMLLHRGYKLVHEATVSDSLFKTSEIIQIMYPVGLGVLVLTLFEKVESLASVLIQEMILNQTLVNSDLYWTITDTVLSIILVYGIYRYCKTKAVQKDIKRETFLFAGGILLVYEARNILLYLVIPFSIIVNLSNYSGNNLELIGITINAVSLLFFIMKVAMGVWYLRNSNRDNTGYQPLT